MSTWPVGCTGLARVLELFLRLELSIQLLVRGLSPDSGRPSCPNDRLGMANLALDGRCLFVYL